MKQLPNSHHDLGSSTAGPFPIAVTALDHSTHEGPDGIDGLPPAQPATPRGGRSDRYTRSMSMMIASKCVWLLGTGIVFFVAWVLGPRLVEHYHYAATRARIQAEYDVATVALKDRPLENLSAAYQMVARRISPSVVHIATKSRENPVQPGFPLPRRQWNQYPAEGQGSGVIIDPVGYIVTNEHVVRDAEEIVVVLSDRRQYRAELIGVDRPTDLAVIKIDAPDLIAAEWGNSDALEVGSMVWAVGSPFGLEQSITFGIVSAKHRKTNENPYQDLLQSDAAVNPGNSGGPLVNSFGQVVGINTSIVGTTYQGISFSVPSSLARPIYDRLVEKGAVERGFLGVAPGLVSHQVAVDLSLPDLGGAFVEHVEPGSPAELAGIREGDVIVAWNGSPITNDIVLFRHVGLTPIDSTAEVIVWRGGAPRSLFVSVAPNPYQF